MKKPTYAIVTNDGHIKYSTTFKLARAIELARSLTRQFNEAFIVILNRN